MRKHELQKILFIVLIILFSNASLANTNPYTGVPPNMIKHAKLGNAEAQFDLAVFLMDKQTERGDSEAIKWYKLSANQGHFRSQFNLGLIYYYGTAARKNISEAVSLFKSSAINGSRLSAEFIGYLYETGEASPYIKKNRRKSIQAYKVAAQRGHRLAQKSAWRVAGNTPNLRRYASPKVKASFSYGGI